MRKTQGASEGDIVDVQTKINESYEAINTATKRKEIVRKLAQRPPTITHSTECPVDTKNLREYMTNPEAKKRHVNSKGEISKETYAQEINTLLTKLEEKVTGNP